MHLLWPSSLSLRLPVSPPLLQLSLHPGLPCQDCLVRQHCDTRHRCAATYKTLRHYAAVSRPGSTYLDAAVVLEAATVKAYCVDTLGQAGLRYLLAHHARCLLSTTAVAAATPCQTQSSNVPLCWHLLRPVKPICRRPSELATHDALLKRQALWEAAR